VYINNIRCGNTHLNNWDSLGNGTGRVKDRGSEIQGGGTRRSEGESESEREREINKW
jgi:hypothetical protein